VQQREEDLKNSPGEGPGLIRAERENPAEKQSDEMQPPVLRRRDAPAENGPPEPGAQKPAPHQRLELMVSRDEVADGVITANDCSNPVTLELTLTSRAGSKQLYSENYYKIPFSALNFTPQGVMNPCSDLKGLHAHITYHPAKDHPEQGEIVDVRLTK